MRARCLNLSLKSLGCLCSPTLAKQYITRLKKFQYRRFSASNLRPPPSPPQPAGCSLPHCWAKLSLRFPSCTPQPSGLPLSVTFLSHLENCLQCRIEGLGAFASVATAEIHSGTRIRSKSGGSGESSPTELVLVQTLLWCKCKLPPASRCSLLAGAVVLYSCYSVSPGLTTASVLHHVSAPGRVAPETQWCTAHLDLEYQCILTKMYNLAIDTKCHWLSLHNPCICNWFLFCFTRAE